MIITIFMIPVDDSTGKLILENRFIELYGTFERMLKKSEKALCLPTPVKFCFFNTGVEKIVIMRYSDSDDPGFDRLLCKVQELCKSSDSRAIIHTLHSNAFIETKLNELGINLEYKIYEYQDEMNRSDIRGNGSCSILENKKKDALLQSNKHYNICEECGGRIPVECLNGAIKCTNNNYKIGDQTKKEWELAPLSRNQKNKNI